MAWPTLTEAHRTAEDSSAGVARIHVWLARSDVSGAPFNRLSAILSQHEKDRANQIPAGVRRSRFLASRGISRTILGRYLGINPQEVEIRFGGLGRPVVVRPPMSKINFSFSDSSEWVAVAVSKRFQVGVDIECLDPLTDPERMAERFFSDSENLRIAAAVGSEKLERFYQIWTAKEAWTKAAGFGLSSMGDVEVVPQGGKISAEPARAQPGPIKVWPGSNFSLGRKLVGAVVAARPAQLRAVEHNNVPSTGAVSLFRLTIGDGGSNREFARPVQVDQSSFIALER